MGGKKESPAVDRALDILEAISERESGLSNSNLARRLGIPKSSASSILRVLQGRGYVCRYSDSGRYKLGVNVLTLGWRRPIFGIWRCRSCACWWTKSI